MCNITAGESQRLLASCKALLEELRMIRMKDTHAVYDVTCRVTAEGLIKEVEAKATQYHCVCWGNLAKCCHCGDGGDDTEVCQGDREANPCDEAGLT